MREEAKRLRVQAAKARRLAKTILPSDPTAQSLDALAEQLDAQAKSLEGEPPAGGEAASGLPATCWSRRGQPGGDFELIRLMNNAQQSRTCARFRRRRPSCWRVVAHRAGELEQSQPAPSSRNALVP